MSISIKNVDPNTVVQAVLQMRAANDAQAVQVEVLKQAMNAQQVAAMTLLMAVPGTLPPAPAGEPGALVNVMA